ncbi:MAG: 2-oxoglutarate dehydrogenase E1 component [Gammaproteobacteria bacterium]|nr:2-oxoglutarate dehydrogenase E1 component [Gammaproteobacteria bacterium]
MDDTAKRDKVPDWGEISPLSASNAAYLDLLYERYLEDPASVDPGWRHYFDALPLANGGGQDISHTQVERTFRRPDRGEDRIHTGPPADAAPPAAQQDYVYAIKQSQVYAYLESCRQHGHLVAAFDPLELREIPPVPELDYHHHGLSDADLGTVFAAQGLGGRDRATLGEIVEMARTAYCGPLASEYVHVADTHEKHWIRACLEGDHFRARFPDGARRRLLQRLTAAEALERYLHNKYVGQKRFSLEGSESLIPLIDEIIRRGGAAGLKEIAIGMAHRGRLNVLVNIMGKAPADLFLEFEGKTAYSGVGSGDVKYHMGFSSNMDTPGGPVHVALAFNPSHLEIVCPVVEGSVRARQERRGDRDGSEVACVLIHGDAAFSGQGVLMETFNMSQSRGYSTKGTLHIVINNQIGFTTSNQKDARSTLYCTDVAKMVNAPIFHVNGDDPEAVLTAAQIALDYRMKFRKDVIIDLVCYRRHGHSEADEPAVTQPLMYQRIRARPTARELYAERLVNDGVIAGAEADAYVDKYRAALDAGACVVPYLSKDTDIVVHGAVDWQPFVRGDCAVDVDTRVTQEAIRDLTTRLLQLPAGFELHPGVARIFDNRRKMAAGALPIDWGCAEILAYATLVDAGLGVRLSGQDSGRGTFFHRHAVVNCQKDDSAYVPLRNISGRQGNFLVTNSLLSEEAVLAFEYGYSTTDPKTLVIWEAQFGDFANNAQVVIDQFIVAGEQKWNRMSGLVMFLPHGYEGQGPEHSSARIERYLQLCAEHNIQVCVPTTPAQIFHLLRRQMLLDCRKPLVVMTPKSLLRHKLAVSSLEDLTQGSFRRVIDDVDNPDPAEVRRIVLCSGKVYFDLLEKRRSDNRADVALVRLEQLYPFPHRELAGLIARYGHAREYVWCQEEPKNQGAWYSTEHNLREAVGDTPVIYAGRPASAAPAVGYPLLHIKQLCALVDEAFGPLPRAMSAD